MVSMRAPFPSPVRSAASMRPANSMSRWTLTERSSQAPQAHFLMGDTVSARRTHTRNSLALEGRVGSHGRGGAVVAALPHALQDRKGSSANLTHSSRAPSVLSGYRQGQNMPLPTFLA